MNKTFIISLISLIAVVAVFLLGYIIGKNNSKTIEVEKEVVKWKTEYLPAIHDTISQPVPYLVFDTDTIYQLKEHTLSVDTLAIITDYFRVRKYNLDFSNDSIGVFKVNLDVTKNMLAKARSEIIPIRTTIETVKTISNVKTLQFYTLLGTSADFQTNKIQIGLDIKDKYLFGVSGIRMNGNYGYTIDLGIKIK